MSVDLGIAFLGLLLTILLVGLHLFWSITALGLGRDRPAGEVAALLQVAQAARWPHVVVPWRLRLPLPVLGFLLLLLVAATLAWRGADGAGWLCLLALAAAQLAFALRPRPVVAHAALALVLLFVWLQAVAGGW